MRGRGGLVTAVFALGAVLYQSGPVSGSSKPVATHTRRAYTDNGKQMSEQSLLKSFADVCQVEIPTRSGRTLSDAWWQKHLKGCFDWIIATVPDPELSQMQLDFDREIESVQNAAESCGYHFDRYWFSWRPDEQHGSADQNSAEQNSKDSQTSEIEERRNLPSVLLFRNGDHPSPGHDKPLAVFLVGETPTSGIVSAQFNSAIRFGRLSTPQVRNDVIKIAGPGFSGSFSSLLRLTDKDQRYIVRTWTADFGSQGAFHEKRPEAHLRTTNDPSVIKLDGFFHYVRENWDEKGPIVLLVEEGTALGGGITLNTLNDPLVAPIYILKFPRGISKLRNATENKERIPGFTSEIKNSPLARRELPFTLKDDGAGSSELPFYSGEQSPVSQESVLFSIASLMKKGSLHYAGIIATDPLDLLFLSRFLRSACPNTRLFTLDPDLLFEHGADGSDYQGVLAITNYPLFAFNQIWTGSAQNTLRIFPSGNSESSYNAVVALLEESWQSASSSYTDLREFTDPLNSSDTRPPLWITVASRSGYAPVAILPDAHHNDFLMKLPQSGRHRLVPEYWESWGYSFVGIWCLCLLYSGAVSFARPSGSRLLGMFSVKPSEPNPAPRAHFLFSMGLCLSILLALWLAVPYIIFKQNAPLLKVGWERSPLLASISGVTLAICVQLLARRKVMRHPTPMRWAGLASIMGAQGVLLICRSRMFHIEFHKEIATILYAGGILLSSSVMALGRTTFPTGAIRLNRRVVAALWQSIVLGAAIVAIWQVVELCALPVKPAETPSLVLIRLWTLLCGGSAVLGATLASAALPILYAMQGLKRKHPAGSQKWIQVIAVMSYLYFSIASALGGAVLLFCTLFAIQDPRTAPERFLAACRSIDITSGVCPLSPLTLLVFAVCVWCFIQLRRVSYHEDRCPMLPGLPDDVFCPTLSTVAQDVKNRIGSSFFHPAFNVAVFGAVVLTLCLCIEGRRQTLESRAMDAFILALTSSVGASLLLASMRFVLIWSAFREFLQQLERHPIREIFNCLPRGFLWIPIWQGGNKKRTHVAITRSLECILALIKSEQTPPALKLMLFQARPQLTRLLKRLLQFSAARRRVRAPFYFLIQNRLAQIGTIAAMELELGKWHRGGYEARSELSTRDINKDALRVTRGEFETEEPFTICSELLALRFVPFINYVLLQLQNLASYLSIGFILLLTAMNSYVFRARTLIDWYLAALFVLLGAVVVTVFSQIDRDAILSRITRTEEGKLDRHFFFRLISYGAIPSVALLGSHVPAIGKFFFSWIKPALEAIH